jgi:hypothetical protein
MFSPKNGNSLRNQTLTPYPDPRTEKLLKNKFESSFRIQPATYQSDEN